MFNKKKKNPVMTIRPPDAINKEYSEVAIQIGALVIEEDGIERHQEKQGRRLVDIERLKKDLLDRVADLSFEMDESQKKINETAVAKQPESSPA